MARKTLVALLTMAIGLAFCASAMAQTATSRGKLSAFPAKTDAMDAAHVKKAQKMINDGIAFLLAARNKDGSWDMGRGAFKPACTAMVLRVLVAHPDFGPRHDVVRTGYAALLKYQQKDGGIYEPKEGVNNYATSLAVMALAAGGDPQHKPAMDKAVKYLRTVQIKPGDRRPDGTAVATDSDDVGGVNYGRNTGRPDMSNATFWVEAMHEAGVEGDDPAMKRAVDFLTRVQNNTETSKSKIVAEGPNDGGWPYSTTESKAGPGPNNRGLRSYGSMTYAGFKSLLYAGVDKNDARVKAAYTWIRTYWGLDSNPNLPGKQSEQGLYYYYQAFAKALRAYGQPVIKDIDGKEHNWRQELVDALAKRVNKDGSWTNDADRWEEGSPILVTCYCLMALESAMQK